MKNRIADVQRTNRLRLQTRRTRNAKPTVTFNLWTDGQDQSTDRPWASFDVPEGWSRALLHYAKKNRITLSRAFEIAMGVYLQTRKTEDALRHLQGMVASRFGTDTDTETGAVTLTIAHDRIELTGSDHERVGDSVVSVAQQLRPTAVTLSLMGNGQW